jgi:transitional endoplasmic reticulum ATPase
MAHAAPAIQMAALITPEALGITAEDMKRAEILARLEQLGGEVAQDDALKFEGKEFVLPKMYDGNILGAAQYLTALDEQLNTTHSFPRTFRYRPNDVAHALGKALKKVFGTTGLGKETFGFFSTTPPTFVTINTGFEETVQVIQGETKFPPLEAVIVVGYQNDPEVGRLGKITVQAPRRYRAHVEGLFFAIEEELRTGSIYRGKAIDGAEDPHFLNLDREIRAVYTEEVLTQLEANVWSLLRHTKVMRDMKLPLKRSVLIEGPYGTGKSLAAMRTAQIAVENEWTFVQVRPTDDLERAMKTASLYSPAVVFFEDIDGVAEKGDAQDVSRLLDLFDGITSKGTDVIAVMTTNFVERIQKGMLRPGRMDAVIHIAEMDRGGVEELIKMLVPDGLLFEIDYDKVFAAYEGFLPAFVKEAVDRTMRYAIARTGGEPMFLTTEDFVAAALGLRPQLEQMNGAGEGRKTPDLETAFMNAATKAFHGVDVVNIAYGDENFDTSEASMRTRIKKETLNA